MRPMRQRPVLAHDNRRSRPVRPRSEYRRRSQPSFPLRDTSGLWRDTTGMWRDAATGWFDAVDGFVDVMGRELERDPRDQWRSSSCRCATDVCREPCSDECCNQQPGCCADQCHCQCCIRDADLVVYTRIGEVRVVPIRIENPRRRQREITLELSQFTRSGGGSAPVQGQVDVTTFVLEPCEERVVILRLSVTGDHDPATGSVPEIGDVDDCLVAYADLRVTGCDIRPIRLAAAVLPRDCDTFDVRCSCGCC